MRAAIEIQTNAQGDASCLYPAGQPEATGALRYIGNPVHNGEITIVSDGTIDFGSEHGYLIQALMLDTASVGNFEITSATIEVGQQVLSTNYTSTDRLPIHAVAGVPYGLGIAMGGLDLAATISRFGKIETLTRDPYDVVFKYEIGIFPAENQANCVANVTGGGQVKGSWDIFSPDGTSSSDDTDAYTALYAPGPTFGEPPLSASNFGFIGSVIYPVSGLYNPVRLDATHYRTTAAIRESTLTFSKTDGSVHERYTDTSDGTLCNYHVNVDIEPTIINVSPNIHHFPANIQGIYNHRNECYYINERVILGRSAARVEISDTPVPQTDKDAVTGITRRFAVTLPRAWTKKLLKRKLREQVFAGESLNGRYFVIFTHGTIAHPDGVFVGSILIDGEKF